MLHSVPVHAVRLIAEIGINHNGDAESAYQLIDEAIDCGADVAKFQLYQPELLTNDPAKLALLKRLLLPLDEYRQLYRYCRVAGIDFACTAFDADSLEYLLDETDMPFIKIASPSVHNECLMNVAREADMPLIISTAAMDLSELGRLDKQLSQCEVTYLHCVSEYPTPAEHANLKRMNTLKVLGRPVGISDHSGHIAIPLAAVEMGARVIECHLTMDKNQDGPDHKASLEPAQFKEMVKLVRARP